jgi:hypothetical protein
MLQKLALDFTPVPRYKFLLLFLVIKGMSTLGFIAGLALGFYG